MLYSQSSVNLYPSTPGRRLSLVLASLSLSSPSFSRWRQLKRHEFFDGIDWLRLSQRHVLPPYLPKVKNGKCPRKNFNIDLKCHMGNVKNVFIRTFAQNTWMLRFGDGHAFFVCCAWLCQLSVFLSLFRSSVFVFFYAGLSWCAL